MNNWTKIKEDIDIRIQSSKFQKHFEKYLTFQKSIN